MIIYFTYPDLAEPLGRHLIRRMQMVLLSSRGNRHLGIANIFLNVETYWFYLYDLCRLHLFIFFPAVQLEKFAASFQIFPKQGCANHCRDAAAGWPERRMFLVPCQSRNPREPGKKEFFDWIKLFINHYFFLIERVKPSPKITLQIKNQDASLRKMS